METEEKRRHQRYGCFLGRKFVVEHANENKEIGEIKDFSRSGISFDSNESLKNEEEIKLDLQISGLGQKIPASVKILWSKAEADKYTYGAAFVNINPESKFDIMDLLYQDWRRAPKA